jgi:hypothetical protein
MVASHVFEKLVQKLEDTGLAHLPGKLLYSGAETLTRGKLYVLGWNPGGDPRAESDSIAYHLTQLASKIPEWNEYCDGVWSPGGRRYAPGSAPMQRRVRHLLASIEVPVRTVCASNVIFVRSRDSSYLDSPEKLAERCWPVHESIFEQIRPQGVLSIGGAPVFEFICNRGTLLSDYEEFPSGHGTWKCVTAHVLLGAQRMTIVSVPHLARYAVDRHPEVIHWARIKLGL